jgi:hypothetical protein
MFGRHQLQGGIMAIFSRKQSDKKPDDQAKVIVDGALEAKPVEDAPAKDTAAKDAAPSAASEPANGATAAASDSAVPEPVAPVSSGAQEVDPEPVTPPVAPLEHRFGIDDAIILMRSLPADPNMSLVVRVVRVTLGAVHVSVEEIVQDALRKEASIKESIATLETQIADMEKQLANLRREISAHQADLKETANVRERLHQADQYPLSKSLPPPITNAIRSTPSKPYSS